MIAFTSRPRTFEVPCTVEIENTQDSLHAHVVLDGEVEVGPGDTVVVHGAPDRLPFGQKLTVRCTAEVTRATAIEREWTRLSAYLGLTELYEVSFSAGRLA